MAKKLSKAKIEYIKKNYGSQTPQEIADRLDISCDTVRRYTIKLGLRKIERKEFAFIPPKQLQRTTYTPGQRIKIHTQAGDKSWSRITRGATVLEVYPRGVLVGIDGKCPGVQLRYSIDYFDLQTGAAVVI